MNKEVAYSDSNRVGKFNILHEVLHDGRERPLLLALFGLCVVLEVYENESGRGKTYIAASYLFQPLAEGEEIPDYRIECYWPDQDCPSAEIEKECIRANGNFRFRAVRQNIVRVPPLNLSLRPQVVH